MSDAAVVAQFEGDTGTLTAGQRRCLVSIIKRHYISADDDRPEWTDLMAARELIMSRLHDLYMDLHVDDKLGIAYKVMVDGADCSLLRRNTAKREDTIVLLYIRRQYQAQAGSGARVVVDQDGALEYVKSLGPTEINDETGLRKKIERILDNLTTSKVLKRLPGEGRYEVRPVIQTLISASRMEELENQLKPTETDEDDA